MKLGYVFRLAFLQLTARASSSLISLFLFAMGMAMISFLFLTGRHLDKQVTTNLAGIDLVAGAKGSPLQLILSTVMHIDYPTGNISLAEADQISRNPMVRATIPMALGDSFMGFRIVGTTPQYATLYNASLAEGVWHDKVLEVSLGYLAAKRTGLSLGDRFSGVHGFQIAGHAHDDHEYIVTGIIKRTATVIDNLILTAVETVWHVHDKEYGEDHDHLHGHDDHRDHNPGQHLDDHHQAIVENDSIINDIRKRVLAGEDISAQEMVLFQQARSASEPGSVSESPEITALLIQYQGPAGAIQMPGFINENTNMQAASPSLELNRLLSLLGYGFSALKILAWIIIIISAINVLIQLFNSLRQGLFQMALMRVMGAEKLAIFILVIFQGILIATGGWVLGLIISRLVWLFLPAIQLFQSGIGIGLQLSELLLLLYAVGTGALAALLPAIMAYKTDVHFTLTRNGRV